MTTGYENHTGYMVDIDLMASPQGYQQDDQIAINLFCQPSILSLRGESRMLVCQVRLPMSGNFKATGYLNVEQAKYLRNYLTAWIEKEEVNDRPEG